MRRPRFLSRTAAGVVAVAALAAAAAMPSLLSPAEGEGAVAGPGATAAMGTDGAQDATLPTRSAPAAVPAPEAATEVDLDRTVAWVDGRALHYSPASAFVLPGEPLHLELGGEGRGEVRGEATDGLRRLGRDSWVWTAPDRAGVHELEVHSDGSRALTLRVFVLVPETGIEDGRLNGYRMGTYPRVPLRGDTMYVRPEGFVEVTEANRNLRVSPRFRLRHFETKQGGGFPRYVALQRRLLTKLELLVDALVDRGYPVRSLHVMSGYRTPAYNRAIGNTTTYSRHVWGDAADVFVDEDQDGWMDDLDGDGDVTRADARVLYDIVDSLDAAVDTRRLVGGLGLYGPKPHRGPFVHLDTRASPARW